GVRNRQGRLNAGAAVKTPDEALDYMCQTLDPAVAAKILTDGVHGGPAVCKITCNGNEVPPDMAADIRIVAKQSIVRPGVWFADVESIRGQWWGGAYMWRFVDDEQLKVLRGRELTDNELIDKILYALWPQGKQKWDHLHDNVIIRDVAREFEKRRGLKP